MRRYPLFGALALAIALTGPASAQNAGAYLAGRQAYGSNDFGPAARYYAEALARDPSNPVLIEAALTAQIGLGDIDRAIPTARRLLQTGTESQIAYLALVADAAERGSWDTLIADLDAGQSVGPLFDGLIRAWAHVGQGDMSEALTAFDAVIETPGVGAFGRFHKALALAQAGDFESAEQILADDDELRLTRGGAFARAQILSQLERNEDALAVIDDTFGAERDPALEQLSARLTAGETVPFDTVTSASDGVAEVFFSLASALNGEASDSYTLIYSRLTTFLRPEHIGGLLLSAELLETLGLFELATEEYDRVPRDDPSFHAAELGRANALNAQGRTDAAVEVLRQLSETVGDLPAVWITLGDMLRQDEQYAEARPAYDRAVELIGEPDEGDWLVFFARGIAEERTDDWAAAEADFRTALELNPGQPQVLNYLGYSLVERNEKLDEARSLIEQAVAARPDSGYITDSLGWILYRLGEYDEAVIQMEKAVELMPVDPVVNDHLGDVLWAVGRAREAEFQWLRALSFEPEDEDAARIRRKLEIGLDAVLEEEGAPPLDVAREDG